MYKVIEFKTVSPLFEQERDDSKCLTFRQYDYKDPRFRALSQWRCELEWYIKITNPQTDESFVRRIYNFSYLRWFDISGHRDPSFYPHDNWRVIEWYPSFANLMPEGVK